MKNHVEASLQEIQSVLKNWIKLRTLKKHYFIWLFLETFLYVYNVFDNAFLTNFSQIPPFLLPTSHPLFPCLYNPLSSMLRHRGSLSNPWEATHLTTTDSLSPSSRKSWVALSSMTLLFLAECARLDLAKVLCSLSTTAVSSECDRPLCHVQKALFAPAFPDLWLSPSLYLFLCDGPSALEEKVDKSCSIWRLRTPQTFIFSTVTELKSFYSPWKEGFRLEGALFLQCQAEHQVSW